MAVIPEYRRTAQPPKQLNAPKMSVNVPAEAFGAPRMLEQAAKTADALTRFRLQVRADKNNAWVSDSLAGLADRFDQYSYGSDQSPGVLSKQGRDTEGITNQSAEDLQKLIDDTLTNAPSDHAAQVFRDRALSLKRSTASGIARHEFSELRKWRVQSSADNASAQMRRISNAWQSKKPEEIEADFTETVRPELEDFAARKGVPVGEVVQENKGKLFKGIIAQNIAAGDTERAKSLFDRWGDQISQDDRIGLTDTIRKKEIYSKAEDTAFGYYEKLKSEQVTPTVAMEEINTIEDDDLKRATRSRFDAYARQFKQDQAAWVAQELNEKLNELDGLFGNIAAQQDYLNSYPDDTASQKKVKKQLEARFNRIKSAQGLRPMTDPSAYAEVSEKIAAGEITDPKQIDSEYGVTIEKTNREQLKKELEKSQAAQRRALKSVYTQANGIQGGAEVSLSGGRKKDYGEFLLWAEGVMQETNRAQEPEYLQKLADTWVLQGESKRKWAFGYGKDETFGTAMKKDRITDWLPDMPDETTTGQIRNLFNTYPGISGPYLEAAEWDEDLAVRMYYREMMKQELGKKGR